MKTFKATAKKLNEGMQVEVSSGGFKLIFDEPTQMGGTNKGMNPMGAALAVMGACQTITAYMFAKSMDIELQSFSVEIEGDMDMDALMKQSGDRTGFQEIRYKMHIKSTASDEKLELFAKFVEQNCPVSDTFNQGAKLVYQGVERV